MVVNEYRKQGAGPDGDRYSLSVVLAGRTEDELVAELIEARTALLEWLGRRGAAAELVMVTGTSAAMHEAVDATIRDIVAQDHELAEPLQERTVIVTLIGPGGNPVRESTWSGGAWS